MKKFLKDKLFRTGKVWSKFWKIMRLQLLIVFVTLFQLHAETGVAQEKVSISFKDALIEDIIKEVEVQSGYAESFAGSHWGWHHGSLGGAVVTDVQ